jgi:hypothetical protein
LPSKKRKDDPPWFHPTLDDVLVDPEVYEKSKLTNLTINKIKNAVVMNKNSSRPTRARKTWIEPVTVEGQKYGPSCRIEDGKIVIGLIKGLKGRKRVARKRSVK